jgi:hypothetical protein
MTKTAKQKKARHQAGWSRAFLAGVIWDAFVPNDRKDAKADSIVGTRRKS